MKKTFSILFFVLFFLYPGNIFAQQFVQVGARAVGMGGAYVAVADEMTSAYWNPAAGALVQRGQLGGYGGVHYADYGDLVDLVNEVSNFDPGDIENIDPEDLEEVLDLLERLQKEGLRANGEGHYGFTMLGNGFGFSFMQLYYGTVYPVIVLPDFGDSTDWEDEINNNPSGLYFEGLRSREFTLTAGRRLGKTLFVGTNMKYIQGRTYYLRQKILGTDWGDISLRDLIDEAFKYNQKDSSAFTFDFGFLWIPNPSLRAGVVGKNITSPSFGLKDLDEKIELGSQWRMGVAYYPVPSMTLAFDLDLTGNEFGLEDPVQNRQFAIGLEKRFFRNALAVRGGFNRNLGEGIKLNSWSAGLGGSLSSVSMEFAGTYASDARSLGLAGSLYFTF